VSEDQAYCAMHKKYFSAKENCPHCAEVRKTSWKTRRDKYGQRGHSGAYSHPRPIYTASWNSRLRTMTDALIELYREGVLSEGQVSKATGLDRVSCRELAIQQAEKEKSQ
jgi:hypothetical protein